LEKGLSQEQLAHMAGVSTRTLQRIERGASASPETLKCIASVLETDFGDLRGEPEMPAERPQTRPETPELPDRPGLPGLSSREQEAMEYVRDIKAFYIHFVGYGVVIAGLAVINLVFSPGYLWVFWAAFGWGLALLAHGLSVFEIVNLFGDDWERRQIEKRLNRRGRR
jgi:transcriptional regulator with XRE-family HTH domain